jgi:hypothetical protein
LREETGGARFLFPWEPRLMMNSEGAQTMLTAGSHPGSARLMSALILVLGLSAGLEAQTAQNVPSDVAARLQALEEQVRALEAEVQSLKAQAAGPGQPAAGAALAAPQAVPQAPPPPGGGIGISGPLPVYGGAAAASKVLNPDISVIGDFLGAAGGNALRPAPSLEMHETEVGFQAIIDPYARGDFFLTFGAHGIGLEEGYITFTSLPGGFVAKAGKFRSAFGKVGTMHSHVLPWTDRPLVNENLLGGEDGINDAGVSLTRSFAGPKNTFLEGTAQLFRGDAEGVFQASRHSDLAVVGHFRGYRDIGESSNIDAGFSYARGHNDLGSRFLTDVYGADVTYRWKPLRRAIYHSFIARWEGVWSNREQLFSTQKAFGTYASAEYRLNRRWTLGGRYDWSARADQAFIHDTGASAVLTYWPSEFSQVRGQYRFARYGNKFDANELRFQFLFVLGAHGAHPF